jgi:hypothetical protein
MPLDDENRSWTNVFHRSRISPYVFVVSSAAEAEVLGALDDLSLPEVHSVKVFDDAHRAWPILDGAVARLSAYGFPPLPSGLRVYGHRPVRLLCYLLRLKPPGRRLKGEHSVPDIGELLNELDRQRRADREELAARARKAMASDTSEVLAAVRFYFGDDAVDLSHAASAVLPGTAAWGDAGISRFWQAAYEGAAVPVTEVLEWQRTGAQPDQVVRCHEYGRDVLRSWTDAGCWIRDALALLDAGRSFDQVEPYLRVGCWSGCIERLLDAGFEPDLYAEFTQLGFTGSDVDRFAAAGIRPNEAAAWREIGASSWVAWVIVATGGNLTDAARRQADGENLFVHAESLLPRLRPAGQN